MSETKVERISAAVAPNGGEIMACNCTNAKDAEIAALKAKVALMKDWMRCADQFAWAHERFCPRHDADEPCTCGLDTFLARPRLAIDGYRATLRDIASALGLREDATAERVVEVAREAAKDTARQEFREMLVAQYPRLQLENDGLSPLTRETTDAAMRERAAVAKGGE